MSKALSAAVLSLALLLGRPVEAQTENSDLPPELQGFGLYEGLLPMGEDSDSGLPKIPQGSTRQSVIPFIMSSLPKATADTAVKNVAEAEQVFCYHVSAKPQGYTGYTLNNFAIVDYCGELDRSATATTYEALFTQSPNIITAPANCRIEPKVMLRFVRGVDYTDVLLSSPCPSFTVFYAGRYNAFNIKQGVIDDIISQFDKPRDKFNSPSLLKKTVANGVAETVQEAEKYDTQPLLQDAPVMNWQKPDSPVAAPTENNGGSDTPADSSSTASKPKTGGWGNIKLRM